MNSRIIVHSKEPHIYLEFVQFSDFVSTKVGIDDPDTSELLLEVISDKEPIVQLTPWRKAL